MNGFVCIVDQVALVCVLHFHCLEENVMVVTRFSPIVIKFLVAKRSCIGVMSVGHFVSVLSGHLIASFICPCGMGHKIHY